MATQLPPSEIHTVLTPSGTEKIMRLAQKDPQKAQEILDILGIPHPVPEAQTYRPRMVQQVVEPKTFSLFA